MIAGTGIDIVEIGRMRRAIGRYGDLFLSKIFTQREIAYSSSKRYAAQHFAARFAAKEAVVKAFGTPASHPIRWTDIEILNDAEGKPTVRFHRSALAAKRKTRAGTALISMSHSKMYAVASAILTRGTKGKRR